MMFYSNSSNLLQFANKIISDKTNSMKNDVSLCLKGNDSEKLQPAPFAALLICFSVMDFLAALYRGNAKTDSPTTEQTKEFMRDFLSYTKDQRNLILLLYRHKLVHISQPGVIVVYKGETFSWRIYHDNKNEHLNVKVENKDINPAPCVRLRIKNILSISILQLMRDVVVASNEYLDKLEKENSLQERFDAAINDIYSL